MHDFLLFFALFYAKKYTIFPVFYCMFCMILSRFLLFFCLFCSVSDGKSLFSIRKSISTSEQRAEQPFAGQNTQHWFNIFWTSPRSAFCWPNCTFHNAGFIFIISLSFLPLLHKLVCFLNIFYLTFTLKHGVSWLAIRSKTWNSAVRISVIVKIIRKEN